MEGTMEVTIIGTGNMARRICSRVLAGGHDLTVVVKDSELAEAGAADISGAGTVRTAVAGDPIHGEVVVLAVYYRDARPGVEQYADQLAGKVVADITNPVNETFDGLVVRPDGSATDELGARPAGRVKAFKTTFPSPLTAGEGAGHKLDALIAGDDEDAKGHGRRARSRRRAQPDRHRPAEARARGRGPAAPGSPEHARNELRKCPHLRP
jgi:predicted dinucleotide-binding enzyme